MAKLPGGFLAALLIAWMALGAAGVLYARGRGIPISAAAPVMAAFLVETPFYLVIGFPALRRRIAGARLPGGLPAYLAVSAVLPYLACCCGAIPFQWTALARLLAMALAVGLWYVVLPAMALTDIGFLALTGALILSRFLAPVYPDYLKQHLVILGHITVIQMAAMALTLQRGVPETGLGFWPNRREWGVGALHFLYFMAIAWPLNLLLRATHPVHGWPLWAVGAVFLGALWVQALSEEFFFRGVLQAWMEAWTRHRTLALALTSAVFGLIHYWFRGWKWVILTAVLGWLCGRARNQTGGIRAGVVTHSLVVATWRAFFW
ncbi:MAG TPA: CPBP family intramembrane glutamic endopeptidase [Bryobacteraceae bacterium]|nr:CPBP family intramembrane glutamic endopeptidase [Bryobacteraceae bacterium]